MEFKYTETGNRILNLRKNQGLTRERLAEMSDISVPFLADIEKGKKNMTVTTLRKLASALLVTTDYIVNGQKSSSSEDELELLNLFKTLSPQNQRQAIKLLRVFAEAIDNQKDYL